MNWKIKENNKQYLVYKTGQGSFTFNNRKDAERLCEKLNNLQGPFEIFSQKLVEQGEALIRFGNALKNCAESEGEK